MFRGTTPTINVETDLNLTEQDEIWLSIADKNGTEVTITKDDMVVTNTSVSVTLTQEQTLGLAKGIYRLQIRAVKDGVAIASKVMTGDIKDVVKGGVISND